jgi:hypothetical protein
MSGRPAGMCSRGMRCGLCSQRVAWYAWCDGEARQRISRQPPPDGQAGGGGGAQPLQRVDLTALNMRRTNNVPVRVHHSD